MKKNCSDFGDLDPIFKVTGGLRLLENGFSSHYLQNEWMDFDQTYSYIVETRTRLIRYCDLDPIFKVTLGLRFWKMAPIAHIHTQKKIKIQLFSTIGLSDRWGT